MKNNIIKVLVLLGSVLASACSTTIEPWVMPYERDNLADIVMSMNRNPVALSYTHHAYQAREGARGAEGGAGGGCGCN
jgi:hypothetical protein